MFTYIEDYEQVTNSGCNVAFEGSIYLETDGLKTEVGQIHNRGDGGCNIFYFKSKEIRELFTAEAKKALPTETFEVEDAYIELLNSAT